MTDKYVIFDLDNCISNDAWRIQTVDWYCTNLERRYARYHALGAFDQSDNTHIVRKHQEQRHKIVVMTARPASVRHQTEFWLERLGINPVLLLMRGNNDHTPSVFLKQGMVRTLPEHRIYAQDIVAAYDDRTDIVQMFNANGLPGSVLCIHSVCAMTPPPEQPDPDERVQIWHRNNNPATTSH